MGRELPSAIGQAIFHLFGIDMRCYVLSDGRRVIDRGDFATLMSAMADETLEPVDRAELARFAAWNAGGQTEGQER